STPCTTSRGSVPAVRAFTIQSMTDGSASDSSGPGSNTYNADTCPASTDALSAARPADTSFSPSIRPNTRAPATFGASTSGTTNLVSAGCGLCVVRQLTVTD